MKKISVTIVFVCISISVLSQDKMNKLPYYEVPDYPEQFTAGTMASRMVDALGFRFYWATEGLTPKDLAYKANTDGRTTEETIQHIYDLSKVIVNSTLKQANSQEKETLSYTDLRAKTLTNLKTASDILRASEDIAQYKIIFGEREIPFWNQVNGPIADSIWHCGQIVIYRRTTENPINPKVNHFTGKVKD